MLFKIVMTAKGIVETESKLDKFTRFHSATTDDQILAFEKRDDFFEHPVNRKPRKAERISTHNRQVGGDESPETVVQPVTG